MRAGFIQIGDVYYGTITTNGVEEVIKDRSGKKIPFPSATRAQDAALKMIDPPAPAATPKPAPFDSAHPLVRDFNARRLADQQETLRMTQLLGVEVVKKRRSFRNGKGKGR